jgi:threonine dehydratase
MSGFVTGSASLPPTAADLDAAAAVVHAVLPPTPRYRWPPLCERLGGGRVGVVLSGGNVDRDVFAAVLAGTFGR